MFYNETYENILKRNIERLPASVDKREGSIAFDAIAPFCMEMAEFYIIAQFLLNQTSILTANREGLINWGHMFSILPHKATYATAKAEFNKAVPIGSRFNSDKLNFKVVEQLEENVYKVICETAGTAGNNCIGRINPINNITGLTSAKITELIAPAEDEEETEIYRERFIKTIKSKAYGGNEDDYKLKVNAIDGVGDCKVYRCPRGGGTVDVVVINSRYKTPSSELVDEVQAMLYPTKDTHKGLGIAPIGHDVKVKGVKNKKIDIKMTVYTKSGTTFTDLKTAIEKEIQVYFDNLAKKWAKSEFITVRTAFIISAVLNVKGVKDVINVTVNGEDKFTELQSDEVPAIGTVTNV